MPSTPVDLRSDTFTKPTPAMRRAMADAEVGDDVYREDPTVRALEELAAERFGTGAALFVPSGTMGNQVCLRLLTEPGDTVVTGRRQHVVQWEAGASEINARVHLELVDDGEGTITVPPGASPSLVTLEDTHLASGGRPWPMDALRSVAAVGLPVHIDGARLWHSCVATGTTPAERVAAAGATTVTSCLSKGLGAPVGSVIGLRADAYADARLERQRLGGAMRQAGILAAAGIVALTDHVERLADDHARAATIAAAAEERWPGSTPAPATNVVLTRHPDTAAVLAHLASCGVRAAELEPGVLRFVTHLDVDDDGLATAVAAIRTSPV
jgi:threonine aldolase